MTYAATAEWLRPKLWVGLVVGAASWVVWAVSLGLGGWYKDSGGQLIGADHLAFYHAAKLIRDGQPHRIYSYPELIAEGYQQQLVGWDWGGPSRAFEAYRNPPFYALLYTPTAGLSYYESVAVWTLIGFSLLALAVLLLRPARPARVLLWALAFFPVFATASFGQNTFISLAAFAGVYRLLSNDRTFAAGLVAGLLWFKPQLLLGLFVWWALEPRRYWRCFLGVGCSGALLAAVSWAVVPEASQAFVETLRTNAGFSGFGMWNVVNPKGFFALLLPEHPQLHWPLAAVCAVVGIGAAWWVRRKSGGPVAVMFPVAVFLSLWASPHALIYEWTLLVAAAVVLWERLPGSRDAWLPLFALAWAGLTATSALTAVQIRHEFPVVVQAGVPVMGMVGWLAARELAREPEERR
ncbi:DUF2029 domain-containing protein [Gemmata sp. JC673]|uniref:DUF2029 domain-containing protein n=1 Tax=Gemmata algarum TaxID=2975278 RepID=A0ABU5F4J7_9BACT|nr:glycosyltransferase family 87 protein [Gemmata algarum]MDY3562250.1 DUF2029 domain-containing protein [Gemmata algarum]